MQNKPLTTEYDAEKQIVFIRYGERHTPEIGREAFNWCLDLVERVGPENVRGCVMDFSQVAVFEETTFSLARSHDSDIQSRFDMRHHPVALIVSTPYQEDMVRIATEVTHTESRSPIVYSEADALRFIDEWAT